VTDAKRIFAEPNTITGSIGVFGLLLNFQKLANNNGITWDVVKTNRYADSQTASRLSLLKSWRFTNALLTGFTIYS